MVSTIIVIAVLVIVFLIIVRNIRIVPQAKAYVIERLGAYKTTWDTGLHFKVPFIESVAKVVSLKEQIADFPPQPVITKDNVSVQVDAIAFYIISDPKLYTYGVENPMAAIANLTATTLRNIVGELELDETLTSRDTINAKMQQILDQATDPWGIKVNRVELRNIQPPRDIQEAMEKQMRAERERREAILRAEGEKRSAILTAEGEKESALLRAEAKKQADILAAEAKKQADILEAEGKAQAIITVNEATAQGLKMLNDSAPVDPVLRLKAMEAFSAAANGRATKIIIPSEIQGYVGLAEGIVESVTDAKKAAAPAAVAAPTSAAK